ncbi:MAG TPA: PAS domain S-box protein [Alphaproteobacteria bacterium]|nr:PAS domain S-box protein [Alphaproteobacteria bacterium]
MSSKETRPPAEPAGVLRDLIERTAIFIYRMSLPDGRYEYVSHGSEAVTGYPPDAFYANPLLIEKVIHPAWHGYFRQAWARLLAGEVAPEYEYAIRDRAGKTRWLHQQNVLLRDAAGAPLAIEGIVTDVSADRELRGDLEALVYERGKALHRLSETLEQEKSDRQQALTRAREYELQLQVMADHLPAAVSYVDHERTYRFVNAVYQKWFGHSPDQVIGRPLWEVLGESAYASIREYVDAVLTGESVSFEAPIPYERGGTRHVRADYVPHWDAERRSVLGFFVLVMDISAEKAAEADERRHLQEVAHMSRIATIGEASGHLVHELTQPITAFAAYLGACRGLLRDGRIEELSHALQEMETPLRNLRSVIGGFRRFLRKGEARRELTDIGALLRGAVTLVQWEADARGTPLDLQVDDRLPAVMVDGALLEQVILNLLRNALDATDQAGARREPIRIAAALSGSGIEVCVEDRGVGLSPEARRRLFEPFFTTKPQGVGIGLVIARRIVESNGGRLWVEDGSGGRGARFRFSIPTARCDADPAP